MKIGKKCIFTNIGKKDSNQHFIKIVKKWLLSKMTVTRFTNFKIVYCHFFKIAFKSKNKAFTNKKKGSNQYLSKIVKKLLLSKMTVTHLF